MKLNIYIFLMFFSFGLISNESKLVELEIIKSIAKTHPNFFIIDESSIKLQRIDDQTLEAMRIKPLFINETNINPYSTKSTLDEVVASLDKIINIGKKIWTIVISGEPVLNINTDWANAVPEGINDWMELHSWKTPKVVNYSYSAKNLYGMNAIEIIYRIIYTYGGKYGDVGNYLTNVKVVPLHINVLWGYSLDMFVEVPHVLNVGSQRDPIGALELIVNTTISTVLKKSVRGQTFFITGTGDFRDFEN